MQEQRKDETFAQALAALPAQAQEASRRDDAFWRVQRLAISGRVRQVPGPYAQLRWAVTFAGLLLAAALLNQPVPAPEPLTAQTDSDHQLLLQVQQALRQPMPEALAPAELLVAEMNSALQTQGNP